MNGLTKRVALRGRIYYENPSGVVEFLQCTRCKEVKYRDAFNKESKSIGGVKSHCRDCDKKQYDINKHYHRWRVSEYRRKNKEKVSESQRLYREANREKRREYSFIWNRENKEYYSNYWQANRDKARAAKVRRRAREVYLPDTLTEDELQEILEFFDHSCAFTGDSGDYHIDHVIPLSTGHGGTFVGNIIPLRPDVNISKSDNNIFEWYEENGARFRVCPERFKTAIKYLADLNGMSVEEYRSYVYDCHANPIDAMTNKLQEGSYE